MSKTLFTINYWYASNDYEIFLDLDSNRSIARALSVLRLSIRKRHLAIHQVWLYKTSTTDHAHMIIVLRDPLDWIERLAWSIWLGNDRLRAAYVLQRHKYIHHNHDLLVSQNEYYRAADDTCFCKEKHKSKKVTANCAAMKRLLGKQHSADYFTRTGKAPPRRKIRVPWGKVSLSQIKNWSPVYEHERERLLSDNGTHAEFSPMDKTGSRNEGPGDGNSNCSAVMAVSLPASNSATTQRDLGQSGKDR